MSRTDRVYVAAIALSLVVIVTSCCIHQDRNRIGVLEIRLQNIEHLFSVVISESRPPAIVGPANRLPALTNEIR